jgi:uncharacterized membrane protein YraQ (UPF0718 family)
MSGVLHKSLLWLRSQWLLSLTVLLYLLAFQLAPQRAQLALQSGGRTLLSVAVLILAVMGLVGLVQVWTDRDLIARTLGKEGGWRALLLAATCGTLVIGPPYLIFPLLMSIRRQGARWAVIGAVLGSYAVKIPMIPLEVGFLGWRFSLARSLLTVLFALPVGLLLERVMERGEGNVPAGGI